MSDNNGNSFDIAAYKREIEAKLRVELEVKVKEEFLSRAETLVTPAQIATELGSVVTTVQNVITGANIQHVIKHGQTKFYDRADIMKAYTEKYKHILAFLGHIHIAPKAEVSE